MLLKKLGKYEIVEWLGGGRFGDVFLGYDTLLEQNFALKLSRMRQEEIVMLKDEAKLLASLNHPNIVRFYNIDIIENKFVLIMEYIKGNSLRDLIKEGGIELNSVINIATQMLEAANYAHNKGILHRDLKPENVLIAGDGVVKITDFGLARFIKSGSISASTAGTPIYMAPEVWSGNFTEKSDIWSIGIILYELLTGAPPFLDDSLDGLKKKIEKNKFLIPTILRSDIPLYIEDVIIKCLNLNPKARPDTEELLKKFSKSGKGIKIESTVSLPQKEGSTIELTPAQIEVMNSVAGKILLLGQAGCGKTATLINAVIKLVERGIPPSKILICTFTNKSANDIKNRLKQILTSPCYDLWLGTFHTICFRILKRDAERLDLSEDFIVQEPKRIFGEMNVKTGKYRINAVMKFIEILKAKGICPDKFKSQNEWENLCLSIYKNYQDYLKERNILDYDDLILYTIKLLEENHDLREFYQTLFEYIFVDELQDINPAQYRLISLFVKDKVFFTGDEDQAIYGWRGAQKELIYQAAKDFENIKMFYLTKSFRLPQTILELANNLMFRQSTAIPNLDTGEVFVYAAKSDDDEVDYLVNEIKNLKEEGFNYQDIVVLYRMNYLAKNYEQGLVKSRIPYALISSAPFYECAEVKPIIDYLELLGTETITLSKEDFIARAGTIFKISKRNVERVNKIFEYHHQNYLKLPSAVILDEILNLVKLKGEGIAELVGLAKNSSEFGLNRFLSELKLIQELDLVDWKKDVVKLLTVHSAKGLEFPVVFMVDLVEDVFPLSKSMSSQRDLEEERRLCYVAITRAQKKLYLCYSKYRFGRYQIPSRFLMDMFKKR